MEYRQLGSSDLQVPVLGFGTATFGGAGPLFGEWGNTGPTEARRLIDICLDAGVTLFDTADAYSWGASEQVLGEALRGRRDKAIVATKVGLPTSDAPDDWGLSRDRLMRAVDASLERLGTDYIDLLQLHACDAHTPAEELVETLAGLIASGKVRQIGVSNYPGWQLMKALNVADGLDRPRFVSHQVYYSLIGRAYEAELMPLGIDQRVGALVWSPLGWGRLTGNVKRGGRVPETSRLHRTEAMAPPVEEARLYRVIDALDTIAGETSRPVAQIAINWLIRRPTVCSVLIGARNEAQLRENLGAVGWSLSHEQNDLLDEASMFLPDYPMTQYRQPGPFAKLNPPPV